MRVPSVLISFLSNTVLVTCIAGGAGARASFAQGLSALAVDRQVVELVVDKHGKKTEFVSVKNTSADRINLGIEVEQLIPFLSSENKAWLQVRPEGLTLMPGEEQRICCKVKLPRHAEGEAVTTLFLVDREEKTGDGTSVKVRRGITIVARVKGTEKVSAEIRDITVQSTGRDRAVEIVVKNTGNTSVRPRGKVFFYRKDGQEKNAVADVDIFYEAPLYAGKERTAEIALPENVGAGSWVITAVLNCALDEIPVLVKKSVEVNIHE